MFLYGLKHKRLKAKLNKHGQNQRILTGDSGTGNIGVLVNADEFRDFKSVLNLGDILTEKSQLQVLVYSEQTLFDVPEGCISFSNSDFGILGTIKNVKLIDFLAQPFTFLISYYQAENVFLASLTGMSKAVFKIGFPQSEYECLNDLTIKTKLEELELFKSELIKYLKIVNRIE